MPEVLVRSTALDGIALTDISEDDTAWDVKKLQACGITAAYQRAGSQWSGHAARTYSCSAVLEFKLVVGDNRTVLKLTRSQFCRVRFCAICCWRRSMKWRAKFFQALPTIEAAYPKHRWVFLTLTVRNPVMSELRATIQAMGRAFKRLTQRDEWPGKGWVKSLEITRGKDGHPHPHFHIMILVNPSYFTSESYVKQARWTELWQEAARLDYQPVVNVKAVKRDVKKSALELLKYEVKPTDILQEEAICPGWLPALHEQLHRVRAVAVAGCLRPFLTGLEADPDDYIGSDGEGIGESTQLVLFNWKNIEKRYFLYSAAPYEGQAVG